MVGEIGEVGGVFVDLGGTAFRVVEVAVVTAVDVAGAAVGHHADEGVRAIRGIGRELCLEVLGVEAEVIGVDGFDAAEVMHGEVGEDGEGAAVG